jgi:hypothetical protein
MHGLLWQVAEKAVGMLRQAQHERKMLNNFKLRTVRRVNGGLFSNLRGRAGVLF